MKETPRMPVLFVGHGSPMNAIQDNEFTEGWSAMGRKLPEPAAVLCISAHWETNDTCLTAMKHPKTIHDFGGFPRELYEVQYPAPGNPELAGEIAEILTATRAVLNHQWGLDHGCWSVMKHFYPSADIPVVQLSLDQYRSPGEHYALARELGVLRKRGILIMGSGNMVHNLGLVAWNKTDQTGYGYDWALEAQEKMRHLILSGDHQSLINYIALGSAFRLAIPTPEHFLPLLYTLALQEKDETVTLFNDKAIMGSLTMTSVLIGG